MAGDSHPRVRRLVHTVAVTALLALTACGARTVTFAPYDITPADADRCASLVGGLPGHLLDQGRRVTASGPVSAFAAAWGDPVISLVCGKPVGDLTAYAPDVLTVDGIDWRYQQFGHAYRFHSMGLSPEVEVTVPDAYQPEAGVLTELAPALAGLATPSPQPSAP